MRLDYNLIALTELKWYQLFYLVAKPTTRLPVSVLGSAVECGVQSKLLLLQFSGQANYRQRVEHSGTSIFNDLFSLISLSKQSGINEPFISSLWRKAEAWNVSFRNSLGWPVIYKLLTKPINHVSSLLKWPKIVFMVAATLFLYKLNLWTHWTLLKI